jgi:light-regulated signal transduction histidine kinase (bacteriophytochrome)
LQHHVGQLEARVAERTAELTAVNHELEAFAYSVSHDLRAPLRSVDGFSQALLEDCADQLDAQGQDYLQRIRGASQRMGQLIDDLLHLSRLTRSEMHWERVDLSALAESIAAGLQASQVERQVTVDIAPGIVTRGDASLLQVVLENLIGNAWKFTAKQAQARIEFGAMQSDNEQVFWVRDDGVGFDMAYAEKLFGAFQRLHSVAEFEGSGIGLATVQRIVHRHGGRIWAEGEPGLGATFSFALPAALPAHHSREGVEP